MATTGEMTERERKAAELLQDLEALSPDHQLTAEEFLAFVSRMPKMPEGWTSADDIREMRGPLPEDDPEFQHNILGRR